jgi:RecA-family ATPase
MAIHVDELDGFFEDDAERANEGYPRASSEQLQRAAVVGARWLPLTLEAPAEWYAEAPPKREWLLRDARHPKARGVLPLGKVGELIAEGGAGKTMVECQLAVAVATSTLWLGALSVASPGRVLLILGEEDAEEARRRMFRAARSSRGPAPAPGSIVVLPLAGVTAPMLERGSDKNIVEAPFLDWLRGYVREGAFRLVVVDPLSRFAGPDAETDNAAATRFVQALESLAAVSGATVLVAHHTNKLSRGAAGVVDSSSSRGSSAVVDGARWQCALSVERLKVEGTEERARLGEVVTFSVTKSNYAAKPDPILLRRDQDNGGALVPVEDDDLKAIGEARRGSGEKAAKRAERDAGRAADAAERERLAQATREHLSATRGAEAAERKAQQERALVAILRAHPGGLTATDVWVKMRAALGTLAKNEHAVIAERLRGAVERVKASPPAHHSAVVWRLVDVSPVSPDRRGLSPAGGQ